MPPGIPCIYDGLPQLNDSNLDACTNACEDARCGDGFVGPGEACDDGDDIEGNGCDTDCTRSASCGANCPPIDFVDIAGGQYTMGSGEGAAAPAHLISIPNFQLARTTVTVAQYRPCVEAGVCPEPPSGNYFNFNTEDHPINRVRWEDAKTYATWVGARLPTEAEWEFAARNRGQQVTYPWGELAANCDRANVNGCYPFTSPVCAFPAGHTRQGLCDMAGGIYEWMEDDYVGNYIGAPVHGSARVETPRAEMRVLRGGSWSAAAANATVYFRWAATAPNLLANQGTSTSYGFRLAR